MSPGARDDRDPLGLLPDFHRSTRMPLDAVVRLHFEGTVAYQNGFAANVSALGMFVKHPDPPPVGTRLVFEFVLGDERKPVQGAGVVSWAREKYEGPGRPAGVGIQFTELDALSRQHVAEALFEYLESQLGVEIADHPDVPDLLAAVPTRAGLDLEPAALDEGPGGGGAGAGEPSSALPTWTLADAEAELATDAPLAEGGFRLFADEPEPAAVPVESEGLFAPVVPPDDSAAPRVREYATAEEAGYGAAKQRERSWAVLAGVPLLVLAGGFAAWWFYAGPGSSRDAAPPAAASAARRAAARPPLAARPEAGETLAEAVGAAPLADASAPAASAKADEPAATPPPAPPPAAATPPARTAPAGRGRVERLTDIAWDSSPGSTVVTLVGDGPFVAGSFRWFEMGGDRPRVLVRLSGMAAGYARASPAAVSPELAGIRVGFHEKPAGNELHVVLDLGSAAVRVESVEAAGELLVIRLAGS